MYILAIYMSVIFSRPATNVRDAKLLNFQVRYLNDKANLIVNDSATITNK